MSASSRSFPFAIFVLVSGIPLSAQWLNYKTPDLPRTAAGKPDLSAPTPRTADGKPDLSGLWNKISPKYKSNVAVDLKPSEIQPWARKLVEERAENLQHDYMHEQCLPLGPGYPTGGDSSGAEQIKIVQTPKLILILNPDLTFRQVFMDGRPLEKDPNPNWMGYSIGHWDGDTLVVESSGYNDKSWLDHDGHPHTEALRMTERYTRRNLGNMDVEITISDPAIYARPWTIKVRADLSPDTEMIEFVCQEANKNQEHWVGKASDEKPADVPLTAATLAKYVGHFDEQPRYWSPTGVPRIVDITVVDGKLYGEMDGRGPTPLLAKTQTEFAGLYGLNVEFLKVDDKQAAELYVKHVSGNYRFTRRK